MNEPQTEADIREIDLAISLAEAALVQCDKVGLVFAAIDISSALDKLRMVRERLSLPKL